MTALARTHQPLPNRVPATIGEILHWLYGQELSIHGITRKDEEFVFEFYFGGVMEGDFEEVKRPFIDLFGKETTLRLCGYCHSQRGQKLSDGFTLEEFAKLGNLIYAMMTFMIFHKEVYPTEDLVEFFITDTNELLAVASEYVGETRR